MLVEAPEFFLAPGILSSTSGLTFDETYPNRLETNLGGLQVPTIGLQDLIVNKKASGYPRYTGLRNSVD